MRSSVHNRMRSHGEIGGQAAGESGGYHPYQAFGKITSFSSCP